MSAAKEDSIDLTLHLADVRELFVEPEYDPFDPHFLDVSGLDELIHQLAAEKLRRPVTITLFLPGEAITPTLGAELRAALDRHLDRRIRWSSEELRATRRSGWTALVYALVLSVIVFLLLAAAYVLALPGWVQALAYAVFIVVAWVSLWWAVETLLFDWLADRRLIRILETLRAAEWRLEPEP
jgi:hypothetical protein